MELNGMGPHHQHLILHRLNRNALGYFPQRPNRLIAIEEEAMTHRDQEVGVKWPDRWLLETDVTVLSPSDRQLPLLGFFFDEYNMLDGGSTHLVDQKH
jgi:hypothetical protein